jgi:hypothetical protein
MGKKGILTRIYTQIKSWGKRHFNKDLYTNKVMGGKGILTRVYIKSLVVFYGFISVKQL